MIFGFYWFCVVYIEYNKTYDIRFLARTEAPCIFPFKHLDDTLHYSCQKSNDKDFYCATSVDENNEMGTHGWCSESCPKEDTTSTTPQDDDVKTKS